MTSFLMTALPASASALPATISLASGEARFIELPGQAKDCTVAIGSDRFPVCPHPLKDKHSLVIAASPLGTSTRQTAVIACPGQKSREIPLTISSPDYPEEHLRVDPARIRPPQEVQERITRERREIAEALTIRAFETPLTTAFSQPLPLRKVTSPFGIRRLYNNDLKNQHTGVDLRAAEGTPVTAPHAGVVRMAQENWYSGGHVIIEHGHGVSSAYMHLSEWLVKPGEHVSQGQIFARSGATGRVTGPHLHWGIYVNGIPVNPIQFMLGSIELFAAP